MRIVIIDDSRFARRLIQQILEHSGEFEVVGQAADGEEGLERIHELQPDFITLDWNMPRLGGLDILRHLRGENQVPVIIVTSLPPRLEDIIRETQTRQVVGIVNKTFSAQSIDLSVFSDELLTTARQAAHRARECRSETGL